VRPVSGDAPVHRLRRVADHVLGLWYIAAAIAYGVAVLLADRYYGLTGAAIAVAACLVVQFAVVEPAERRRRRRAS
jgi:hypothetical protein